MSHITKNDYIYPSTGYETSVRVVIEKQCSTCWKWKEEITQFRQFLYWTTKAKTTRGTRYQARCLECERKSGRNNYAKKKLMHKSSNTN